MSISSRFFFTQLILLILFESIAYPDSFKLHLIENDVQEFVINKNSSKDYIIHYKTSIGDNTYVCKINKNGNPIFHVATQIPSELTVINVFSENDDVKFHVIGKNKKQFFVDLIIDDGESDKKNFNLFALSKSEKILNILQMGDHTLLLTLPEDSTFLYLYKFDDQGLKPRKRIVLESKMILNEIEKFGLQDMSNRFNPMPMASANTPCKLYVVENELILTLDKYDDEKYEFIHCFEKINLINDIHISKQKTIPYDKKIYGTASTIYNRNMYFLSYFKNELFISVTNIEDERQLGEFKIFTDMSFDSLATIYSKIYPKDKLSKTSTKVLDKKNI